MSGVKTTLVGDLLEVFNDTTSPHTCRSSEYPLSFEDLSHPYGYVLYWTYLPADGSNLTIPEVHDAAFIYVDGEYQVSPYKQHISMAPDPGLPPTHVQHVAAADRIEEGPEAEHHRREPGPSELPHLPIDQGLQGAHLHSFVGDTLSSRASFPTPHGTEKLSLDGHSVV